MNNALKLVRTADTLAAAQHRPKRTPSARQQEITANLSLISRTWRTLTDAQRQGWTDFGKTWSPTPGKSTAKGLVVFQALNGVRLNTNQGNILRDAPIQPEFIGKLPAVTVVATLPTPPAAPLALSSDPDTADNSPAAPPAFALRTTGVTFYAPVQVLATRPLSSGVTQPSPKDFRQIAVLYDLNIYGASDFADAYLSVFPAPALGMKIALQIVPITPSGFKGNPSTQIVSVTAAPPAP